jgi:hypothetical protein
MRVVFGPQGEEVARVWRRLHNEELHNLHASPNIIRVRKSRRLRWEGHVARIEETMLVGKAEGKTPLGRPRLRRDDNIKIDIGWKSVDWIGLAQDKNQWRAVVFMVMNLRVP